MSVSISAAAANTGGDRKDFGASRAYHRYELRLLRGAGRIGLGGCDLPRGYRAAAAATRRIQITRLSLAAALIG